MALMSKTSSGPAWLWIVTVNLEAPMWIVRELRFNGMNLSERLVYVGVRWRLVGIRRRNTGCYAPPVDQESPSLVGVERPAPSG